MKGCESLPFKIQVAQDPDGRWLAEVPELSGVMAYGHTRQQAIDRVQALSYRILADRLAHGESVTELGNSA